MRFTIHVFDHGVVVEGPLPASFMETLVDVGEALDFDLVDGVTAGNLGVSMAITNEECMPELRRRSERGIITALGEKRT